MPSRKVKWDTRLRASAGIPSLGAVPSPASRVLVVADAHLGQVPPAVATAFHRFLDAVPDLGDALVINGDLFDFWFEYGSVIPRRHFGTVAKLHALRSRGIPITFVGGNHDRWGGDFLIHDLGIAFYPGEAEVDLTARRLTVRGEEVALTAREFDLLAFFVQHPGRVYSREQLMQAVWGAHYIGTARTVDNFVGRLRAHIGDDADRPRHLETVRGFGYRFAP